MLKLRSISMILCLTFLLGSEQPLLVLTAEPGHYNFHEFGTPSTNSTIRVKLKILEYTPDADWPTGAYFGFYDADSRNNSVHFLLLRNNQTDKYSVAGYRIIENGEEIEKKAITQIRTDEEIDVTIEYSNGTAVIKINCEDPVVIKTNLKKVTPSVSVSSGQAYFNITTRAETTQKE